MALFNWIYICFCGQLWTFGVCGHLNRVFCCRPKVKNADAPPVVTRLTHMVEIAIKNPHCELLCFTKKYDIVNEWILTFGDMPSNLHIIFSAWRGLEMNNKYGLPEAHVRYRNGETTANDNALECGGNCTECAICDDGCWTLQRGQQVVFNEH